MKPKYFEHKKGMAIYVHIPFCLSICTYCDFSKLYYKESWVNDYLKALKNEIETANIQEEISTIYIGGGTPTSLNEEQLEVLLKMLYPYSHNVIEYTIEINPETMTLKKLQLLKQYNVTRLSIGVQTFNEDILAKLERKHSNQQVFNLIEAANQLGFEDISIDLMYNLPSQTIKDIQKDLKIVETLKINHISYYSLILEEHTVLYNKHYQGMSDDEEYECSCLIVETLKQLGFKRYEISNFAKEGYQSMHNLVYWHNEHYYGFGLGAHGFIDCTRYFNTKKMSDYNKGIYQLGKEELSLEDMMFEGIMLGLRLTQGINVEQFNLRYKCDLLKDFKKIIQKYIDQKMLLVENGYLKTTPLGMDLLHVILIDFMEM